MSVDYNNITDEEITAILSAYITQKCCARTNNIKKFTLKGVDVKNGYLYVLHSFTETRITKWKEVPYLGGYVDGPENGPMPYKWDVTVTVPNSFEDDKRRYVVPHSEEVKICGRCNGIGKTTCSGCGGMGGRMVTNTRTDANGNTVFPHI